MIINELINDAIELSSNNSLSKNGMLKFPASFAILRYSGIKSSLHQILLEHLIKAEKIIPDGSKHLLNLLKTNDQLLVEKKVIFSTLPSKEKLKSELIKNFDLQTFQICISALELAGADGKIFLNETNNSQVIIELKTGVRFNSKSPTGDFLFLSPKFLVIDGYIESVSEIHRLLTEAAETKEEVILICRGLSADVLNTISVNLKRCSINLRPIIVNFDENGINTLKDICIATQSRLLSSDLGDLVSSLTLSDAKKCGQTKFKGDLLQISVNQHVDLRNHLKFLREKITSEDNDIKISLLKNRLYNLSARYVDISIPNGLNHIKNKQEIDSCLREIKHYLTNGLISELDKVFLLKNVYESIKNIVQQTHLLF